MPHETTYGKSPSSYDSPKNSNMTEEEDLYGKVLIDLSEREVWETRQDTFYQMRNHGLRRKNKPYPGASDMHFPLVDNTIRKMIPFYYAQYSAQDLVAKFIAGVDINEELRSKTGDVEQWFDYKMKEETNFEDELMVLVDYMLQTGHGILKTRWNIERKEVEFDAVDPLYIIVPGYTKSLEQADRITEVIHYSTREYMSLSDEYRKDDDLVTAISQYEAWSYFEKDDSRYDREGITRGHRDQIIIWNTYVKRTDGDWDVHYYSPNAPDRPVRDSFVLPYKHGMSPYTDFLHEKKEKRFYESRGISELLGVYELSATKMWNLKLDAMNYYNNPIYTVDGQPSGNMGNLNMRPGQVFPNNLRRVDSGAPAISWDEEIQRTQIVAEDTAQVPDFGVGDKYGKVAGAGGSSKTATEVNAIGQMVNTGVDLKARLFRRSLTKVYTQAWSLYQQYHKDEDVDVMIEENRVTISKDQMNADYRINPSGAPDSWDKDRMYSKAVNRFQMLSGNQYTDQGQLAKDLMEYDEVGLSKRLYVDPNNVAAEEAEDEAIEIGALLLQGHPAIVKPSDDDYTRIMVLATKLISMAQNQEQPTNPQSVQMIQQHMEEHFMNFAQKDSQASQQLREQVEQMFAEALGIPPEGEQPQGGMPQ